MSDSPWEVLQVQVPGVSFSNFNCLFLTNPPQSTPCESNLMSIPSEQLPMDAETRT